MSQCRTAYFINNLRTLYFYSVLLYIFYPYILYSKRIGISYKSESSEHYIIYIDKMLLRKVRGFRR